MRYPGLVIYDFGDFKFSDSTTGENTTTGYVNRIFVTFCDMSQKAIDTTGYGPRPCGVTARAPHQRHDPHQQRVQTIQPRGDPRPTRHEFESNTQQART